jgi:hypothetical protein
MSLNITWSKRKIIATTNDNNKMATKQGKNGSAPADFTKI